MKKMILTVTLMVMASMANAESLKFQFSGLVGLTGQGFNRIFINPTADGKLSIRSVDGDEVIEAKVIADGRATDGNLELDLGKGRTLIVTSGFSPDGKIQYLLKTGSTQIELNPIVFLNVK